MLNYSIEVFYSPILKDIYSTTVLVMLGVNTIAFLFIIYAIICHGKILKMYRLLLFICFILSYSVDVVLAIGHMVPLLPATVFYFDGILGRYMDAKIMLMIYIILITIKLLTNLLVLIYRYSMSHHGILQEFFKQSKNLWATFIMFMLAGIGPPFMILWIVASDDVYAYINQEAISLKELQLGSNVTYIPRNLSLYIITSLLIIMTIVGNILGSYCLIMMAHKVIEMKSEVSKKLQKLQKMLFLSTLIESTVTGFLICLPMLVTDLAIMFPIPYGSHIAYIMFTTMSFQTLVSSILQVYFIKPFKKAALELIFVKVIRNLICKKGSSSSPALFVQRPINSRISIVGTTKQEQP